MEAILGIVVGFLGPAIELGKCIAEPIKRQFNYLCCFNNNVQNLEDEAQKLEAARYGLEMKVNTEQNNAQVVVPQVKTWLEKVSEIQKKKPGIDNEITTTRNGGSTVGSRFSLSKKVKKMAEAMKELRQSGNFNTVAHPPPPAAITSIRLRSTLEFHSRKRIEDEIMASLKDEKVNMLGICGMGGVGKTTMAKTIMHRARKELGFEETVMAVVSQKVDMLTIQDDIAKSLGLKLGEGSLSSKAHGLRTRLTAGTKRSLIVLDDVWENLKLEDLGIPCHSGCKVVLTSRDSAILKQMYVEKVHGVQVLSKTEAWDLFISNVGSCIEQENVGFVARQVVDECKGLPIALVTVGVALKDMANISRWNIALSQLKSCNPRHMREVLKCVYQPLKLSYDLLETDEQKSLILLCCLFPEDENIPLETLAIYAMGLHMYEDITSLERARDITCFLVDKLKSCFLLLESYDENHVKMHDVVRDVAIFIASEEKRINCNGCTWISPNIGEKTGLHVGSAAFPNLHLLLIDRESRDKELAIHDDFFEGMSELNVFSIECPSLQRLPQTIELLKNLKTLVLESCGSLESISVVGELVNLEILICRYCDRIESLPVEIGRVSRLRLLELSDCENLKTIAPGIISNLTGLEELIVEDFDGWEGRIMKEERKNASLSELEHLSSLTRLKIKIKDCSLAAEQIRLSPNMVKYDITIGDITIGNFYYKKFEKTMRLELPRDITLGKWIHECVRSVEYMSLRGDGSRILDLRLAQNMRRLDFGKCSTVKKLVNTATLSPLLEDLWLEELTELEEICPYQQNLVSITIIRCGRLRNLFSLSVMESGCFLQLERLAIHDCEMMEQAFLWNGEEENQTNIHTTLVFPKLKFLSLQSLPRLTSLCKGIESIEFPLLQQMKICNCPLLKSFVSTGSLHDHDDGDHHSIHFFCKPNKVKFGCLSKLEVYGKNDGMRGNWCPQIPIDSFARLCELKVSRYEGMKSLFSLSMTARSSCFLQLERLVIESCDMMEQVFLWNEEEDNQTNNHIPLIFPKLKFIKLDSLLSLASFIKGIEGIEFPLLAEMSIVKCPLLKDFVSNGSPDDHDYGDNDSKHFFCKPNQVKFGCLSKLEVYGENDGMRGNWCPQIPIDFFARLCELKISRYEGMKSLFSLSMTTMSPCLLQLERLEIESCGMMEQVFLWNEEEDGQMNNHIPLIFPKLKFIKLNSLPSLTSFIKGIEGIEFPLLAEMSIVKCPLLKGFVSSGSPDDHDIGDNDSMHFFCKPNEVIFGCLSKLVVHHVNDKMRRNWCPQIPIDCFVGLRELEVSGFEDMKSLFSLSMTARGSCIVVQLERLEIRICDMMEQVLLWNEEDDDGTKSHITLVFPNLKFMCLQSLPRLTSFCKGIESIEFSLLNKMHVSDCPLLKGFVSTGSPDYHDYADKDSIHFFCKPNEVKFGRLSKLNVEMERNLCPQIPIDFFAGLSKLNVSGFKGLKTLFSFSMTESCCLLQLEKLEICRCDMMEQVILWKEEEIQTDIHITLFPKLKFLSLDSLPRLTSLIKGIESIQFIVPDRMRISNCPLLESCVSTTSPTGSPHDNDDSIHLLCKPHKVEFDSLKELELEIGGYDNMRRNWCPQIPIIDLFARLCELEVNELKGMESLFPCSIARILRNIRSLGIYRCEEMVKVIEDDASGGETETTPPIRLFPNLEDLSLIHLPKLKSFCEWRCALQLPSLNYLHIINCDLMEELTSGPLNTPNLKYLLIDDHNFSVKDVKSALQLNRLRREEERKTLLEKSSAETKEKEIEEIEM